MSKAPSAETQLRTAKSELRAAYQKISHTEKARDEYRARATRAEAECAEWKRRFDALLARDDAMLKARGGAA